MGIAEKADNTQRTQYYREDIRETEKRFRNWAD
jgi:hypothetical protein